MSCKRKKRLNLSSIGKLAKEYAKKNQVEVIVYFCNDYDFCEASRFNYSRHKPILKINSNGEAFRYRK